jgi:hypothetical protein
MARVFCKKGECNEARRRRHEGKYGKDFSPDVIFLTLECGRNDLRLPMPMRRRKPASVIGVSLRTSNRPLPHQNFLQSKAKGDAISD